MNKIILIGNLTKDPELGETPNGIDYCKFSIAVNRPFTNADGDRETDYFNLTVWRDMAKNCGKFLRKGNKVAVEGRVQNRTYENDEGIKRTITEIIPEKIEFLSQRQNIENNAQQTERPNLTSSQEEMDLPF